MNELARYLRDEDLTQSEFAEKAGISAAMVSQVLSGQRFPGLWIIQQIERASGGRVPQGSWKARRPKRQGRRRAKRIAAQ